MRLRNSAGWTRVCACNWGRGLIAANYYFTKIRARRILVR